MRCRLLVGRDWTVPGEVNQGCLIGAGFGITAGLPIACLCDLQALFPPTIKRNCQPVSQHLEVYIDYKSPYAFIAKDPTYALEQDFDVDIQWLPLTLNIGSYLGTAKVNNSGKVVDNQRSPRQWAAVKYAYMDARRYASLRGLTLRGTQKIWDSSLAAIGMLWAGKQHHDVLKSYTPVLMCWALMPTGKGQGGSTMTSCRTRFLIAVILACPPMSLMVKSILAVSTCPGSAGTWLAAKARIPILAMIRCYSHE
jgi:hypothetical protein